MAMRSAGIPIAPGKHAKSALAEARYLLRAASEIEHGLLVQYLYASYAARDDSVHKTLRTIAVQEMFHLLSVQNILRAVNHPPFLDRPDFVARPPGADRQAAGTDPTDEFPRPFPFFLDKLTKGTVADFVYAESPLPALIDDATLRRKLEDVVGQATTIKAADIHHVGALYAALYWLFKVDDNAPTDQEWPHFPRATILAVYAEHGRPEKWHVRDRDLAKETDVSEFMAVTEEGWQAGDGSGRILGGFRFRNGRADRADILATLSQIAAQGEGWLAGQNETHFEKFLGLFDRFDGSPAEPKSWSVPANPTLSERGEADRRIDAKESLPWARLFNVRYQVALLKLSLALSQSRKNDSESGTGRAALIDDAIQTEMMVNLKSIGRLLVTLKRHDESKPGEAGEKAAPTFELPATALTDGVKVPDQWAKLRGLIDEAKALIDQVKPQGRDRDVNLDDIASADAELRQAIPIGASPDGGSSRPKKETGAAHRSDGPTTTTESHPTPSRGEGGTMPLIDQVRTLLNRLLGRAPGWGDLLRAHDNLNVVDPPDLAAELARPLAHVDRTLPGFRDYAPEGRRAIEPGDPARSLLYHALASPLVHPPTAGGPPSPEVYPTLEELDVVENYVYAAARRNRSDFPEDAVVAVFAYQYKTGTRSPHGLFADVAYSRTGIARVGTTGSNYDPARRSFWPVPSGGGDALAVMPARYGAFLAVARRPAPGDVILNDEQTNDRVRTFLFPVHKLFPGDECLVGSSLSIDFGERHLNEKLRRLHADGDLEVVAGFDVDAPPFVRDTRDGVGGEPLASLQTAGATRLVVPAGTAPLVRTATQRNASTGKDELARFLVPSATDDNRFWTSYQTPVRDAPETPTRIGRKAPGYVNIRHLVTEGVKVEDINETRDEADFQRILAVGGFEAAHFIDDSCDGCVAVKVQGLAPTPETRAAYSLVTAPDFFPLIDQIAITDWVQRRLGTEREQFKQGEPWPLCDGRSPANPRLNLPTGFGTGPAFSRDDRTIMAIVGRLHSPVARPGLAPLAADTSVSYLTDAASNEFAPGWDVTRAKDDKGEFYTTFGLGSPFPEDSKLCAALNSFWPAAAPDAARTLGVVFSPTAMPLLDAELGFHPDHPRVRSGAVASARGWDGEFGPFFEDMGGETLVNCASQDRSDYTSNAALGRVRLAGLASVTAEEMIARMEALRSAIHALPANTARPNFVSTTEHFLVSAEAVDDWAARADRGDARLSGRGYLYEFARLDDRAAKPPTDRHRVRFRIAAGSRFTAQVTAQAVCWRQGQGPFHFVAAL
jgi:hypothetical protein